MIHWKVVPGLTRWTVVLPDLTIMKIGDTLSYASSDAGVTVNLATAKLSDGHAEGDTIATIETDHDMRQC